LISQSFVLDVVLVLSLLPLLFRRPRSLPLKLHKRIQEEEIATERVPDISKLDFDIDINPQRGVKLNNLMGTYNGQSTDEPTFSAPRISKEQALEDFKREAGYYPSRQSMNEEE